MPDDALLAGQQEYYQARAPEYDEWWERRGRYDRGGEINRLWFQEQAELYAALEALGPLGDVLELACGTGAWTRRLAAQARSVTAIDGSAAMLQINAGRVRAENVRYHQSELFGWQPDREYDTVAFGFWLSHVPEARLDGFLDQVRAALKPGGRLFFVDSRREPQGTSLDQPLSPPAEPLMTRRLNDGREFTIVKMFYEPDALAARFAAHGIPVEVRETARFFIYGAGRRI